MQPGKITDCTHHTRGGHSSQKGNRNRLMDSDSLPSKKMDQDPKGFVSQCFKMASPKRSWGCDLEPGCGKSPKSAQGTLEVTRLLYTITDSTFIKIIQLYKFAVLVCMQTKKFNMIYNKICKKKKSLLVMCPWCGSLSSW